LHQVPKYVCLLFVSTKSVSRMVWLYDCYNVAITQINYPILNKQDSIEQEGGQSHKEDIVQVFMLDDLKLGGFEVI
jgi:hypothetical protein